MRKPATEARTIDLGGRRIQYRLRKSPSARRCRIRILSSAVEVVVPRAAEEDRDRQFLRDNADWVLEQLSDSERQGSIRVSVQARTVLFRGISLKVEIAALPARRGKATVSQEGDNLRVLLPAGSRADPWRTLECWLRDQARQDLLAQLARRSRDMGVRFNKMYLRSQRTKWGNCSPLRNLSFNWRLIMAPPSVLDYLVVHELAHLREPTHSTRFWLIVQSHCPDHVASRRWLASHQEEILAAFE